MTRVVFQIVPANGDHGLVPHVHLVEPVDDAAVDERFTWSTETGAYAADPEVNAHLGAELYRSLAAHKELGTSFTVAMRSTDDRVPVYADVLPLSGAEGVPWEALRFPDEGPFLALEPKYALARVVRTAEPRVPLYPFEPPLRVVAVLSCLGLTAAGELAELRHAAQAAGPGRVSLLVVLGEEALAAPLLAEVQAGTAPEVADVKLVPPDFHELRGIVQDFRPHVLHLFCHGSADGTVRLALKNDWGVENPGTGLVLDKEQLAQLTRANRGGFWLVVLNCCEGAAAGAAGLTSMARELVSKGRSHAVIGMREPIRGELARLLTSGLYGALVDELGARIDAADDQPRPLDWAALTVLARNRVVDGLAQGTTPARARDGLREWTLPALYLRWDEFQLQVAPPPDTTADVAAGEAADEAAGGPAVGGPAGAAVAGAVDTTDARASRLEVAALQFVLESLPPDQGGTFRGEAAARIRELAARLGVAPDVLGDAP
ncbi:MULTISPECIES: CHAT domain-containing protein [unclassified Isoptericola]|uniref:CHAT domain-containing protein n=1 Tax=unclassified Isoptericola TaxID=2623355 RepID=UPI003656EA99